MIRASSVVELMAELGAGDLAHPGGDLLSHLQRTGALLREWGAPEPLWVAGLCHAAYGTDGFPTALLGLDERHRLGAVIGDEAEAIVYRYDSCDRHATYERFGEEPMPFTDRFDGTTSSLAAADAAAFATLTVANELDIVRHGRLDPGTIAQIVRLFEGLTPYAPEAASVAVAEVASKDDRPRTTG